MRWSVMLVAGVTLGCGGPRPSAVPQPAPTLCAKAADQVVLAITKNVDAEMESKIGKVDGETADKIRHVVVERCETDAWDVAVQRCFVAAATIQDADRCGRMLSVAQRTAIDRQMAAALGGNAAKPASAAPPVDEERAPRPKTRGKGDADPCEGGE